MKHHFALATEAMQPQERPRRPETRADAGVGPGVALAVGRRGVGLGGRLETGAAPEAQEAGTGGAVEGGFVSFEAAVQLDCPPLTAAAPVRLRVVRGVVLVRDTANPDPNPTPDPNPPPAPNPAPTPDPDRDPIPTQVRRVVPDLPQVDVPACVVHGERFAELRHDAAGTPLPAPAGTHLALALSNGRDVLRDFVV